MNIVEKLKKQKLINPPKWLPNSIQYNVMMGSHAYGVSDVGSDIDVYGFCIPHKDMIFPHLSGEILGFGKQVKRFEQWSEHHIETLDGEKEYDFAIYSIVKYFQLCMDNNPNMIDSLFVPQRCILHSTNVGNIVRENRKLFLHKGSWHKFKGYAYSQLHKMKIKQPTGKRRERVEKFGYDTKFGYHVVRLLGEVEQILTEGDIDLERNREQLKAIRRGDWKLSDIDEYFNYKEKDLETLYTKSTLQHSPKEGSIKQLLLDCLEEHFGSLDKCIVNPSKATQALSDIQKIVEKYQS